MCQQKTVLVVKIKNFNFNASTKMLTISLIQGNETKRPKQTHISTITNKQKIILNLFTISGMGWKFSDVKMKSPSQDSAKYSNQNFRDDNNSSSSSSQHITIGLLQHQQHSLPFIYIWKCMNGTEKKNKRPKKRDDDNNTPSKFFTMIVYFGFQTLADCVELFHLHLFFLSKICFEAASKMCVCI